MLILDGKSLLPKSEFISMMQSLNQIGWDSVASILSAEKRDYEHKAEIKDLLERQLKSQDEQIKILKEQAKVMLESDSIPPELLAKLGAVYLLFPQFQDDFPEMIKEGFIKIDFKRNGLETPYAKGFIYDYFKFISEKKNIYWKPIELLFAEKTLRSALGARSMPTQGMEKWAEFKRIDRDTILAKIFSADG